MTAWRTIGNKMLVVSLVLSAAGSVARAGQKVELSFREQWSGVFSGSEAKFTVHARSAQRQAGVLNWRYTANRRTLQRGDASINLRAGERLDVAVRLRVPAVKPGVVFPTRLTVTVSTESGGEPLARLVKEISVYPRNPFADRTQWLESRRIVLYDPNGNTADRFEETGIPHRRIRTLDSLAEVGDGMIILGEGVSFRREQNLPNRLLSLASRGIPVLVLAPTDGEFPWPVVGNDSEGRPCTVCFQRRQIIAKFDKRLDAEAWPPEGEVVLSGVDTVPADGEGVALEVKKSPDAWPWFEVEYPVPRGRLVIVGFGIVKHWQEGPTPRFLLAQLFEYLSHTAAASDLD